MRRPRSRHCSNSRWALCTRGWPGRWTTCATGRPRWRRMSKELEHDLERALGGLPGSSDDARERALRSALDALPPAPARSRRWRGPALLAVALAGVLTAAGVTLAA